jgi:hypothetical protein
VGAPDPSGYDGTYIPAVLAALERDYAWLGRKMGVSRSLILLVIQGKRSITRNFVDRACRALSLPEQTLFFVRPTLLASKVEDYASKELEHVNA